MKYVKKGFTFGLLILTMFCASIVTIPTKTIEANTEEVWRHFASGADNDNAGKAALLKSDIPEIDMLKDGEMNITFKSLSTKTDTRFGIYLRYLDKNNFVFVGVDNYSNWFYEYKVNGTGAYPKLNVTSPQQGEEAKLKLKWEGNKLFININGKELNSGNAYQIDALESLSNYPLRIKAGSYSTAVTDILFKDVEFKDKDGTSLNKLKEDKWSLTGTTSSAVYEENYKEKTISYVSVSGQIINAKKEVVENATVTLKDVTVKTDGEGKFQLKDVPSGKHNISVSKAGYATKVKEIEVFEADINIGVLELENETDIDVSAPAEISSESMSVGIDNTFPRVILYTMHKDLEGRKFYGNTNKIETIKINGVEVKPTVEFTQTKDKATYVMSVKDTKNNIDAVITATLSVRDNELVFQITNIKDNKIVKTIEITDHSLISVRSTQSEANFAGTNMSTNTHKNGDIFSSISQLPEQTAGYMYGFLSTNSLSAGIWSNSENKVTSDWQRITSKVTSENGYKRAGLGSTYWTYQKGEAYRKENGAEELPCVKVVLTGDVNGDDKVDWQDGAIAYRNIMSNPYGYEDVADSVAIRIAMNFGSQAQNPFLTTLDNVKKVYLNTDGLGQSVLLKGYGSEGHDSGHLNYADIGRRIGGSSDMKALLKKGKDYGTNFGVHINASETYPESKYFEESRLKKETDGTYSYGWNWLDQGVNIDANYDLLHGRAQRLRDFYDELGGKDNDLNFIYVDVWGNGQSGDNGTWASSQLAKEIKDLNWRVAGEWGYAFAYDSTFQHWASDLTYGGYSLKGINSKIARFIQNHQRDSWVGDYPSYGGAAVNPLLGGYDMKDFEGWQGRNDYKGYIENLYDDNIASKFVQHFEVTNWVDGTPVTMSDNGETYSWTPEMSITLNDKTGTQKLKIDRQSNDVNNVGYKLRTMTLNDKVIMNGETYLIPWNWDAQGNALTKEDEKLYHWNQKGGTTTWQVPEGWSGNAVLYELGENGKQNEKVIPIVDGKITITAKAKMPYVVHKTQSSNPTITWSEGMHIKDAGFNSNSLADWKLVGDASKATIVSSQANNRMLAVGNNKDDVSLTQTLTDLKANQQYAVYIGVDNRSDAKAYLEVSANGKVSSNYTEKSIAKNYISAYAHNNSNATIENKSYFQNMYVFFKAPSDGSDVTLTLRREAGSGLTYYDDLRIFENESNMYVSDTRFKQNFEQVPQGIFPFVVGGAEGVSDNRTHLSEKHEPYTQIGWNNKAVDDVLEGNWSLKTNGLTKRKNLIYQTIPQNYRFEPGVTYNVTFDYEVGTTGTYGVVIGDGEYKGGLEVLPLEETVAQKGSRTFKFRITGSASGQTWFGIYSSDKAEDTQGANGKDATFRGYGDVVLDNITIEKTDVNKAKLEELVKKYEKEDSKNFANDSFNEFKEKLVESKAVLDDLEATQVEVDEALANLQTAIDGLEKIAVNISGHIFDDYGFPAKNADITITLDKGNKLTLQTDEYGYYKSAGILYGTWDIKVNGKYHEEYVSSITAVKEGKDIDFSPTLITATSSLSGQVSAVGTPIENAKVSITYDGLIYETNTDQLGNYSFEGLRCGPYSVNVTSNLEGYMNINGEVDVVNKTTNLKNFMLEPSGQYDYENSYDNNTTSWKDLAGNTSSTTIEAKDQATVISFPGKGHANVYDSEAPRFKNGIVEMDLTAVRDSERLGLLVRANDMNDRIYIGTLENNKTWFVEYWGANGNDWSSEASGPSISADKAVHIKVEIIEKTVKLWVDGTFVLERTMPNMPLKEGSIGLNTRAANQVKVDNIKVISYDPAKVDTSLVVGKIVDNEIPTEAANITMNPLVTKLKFAKESKSVLSDSNGNYKFKDIPYGTYLVKAEKDGKSASTIVEVKKVDGYIVVQELDLSKKLPPSTDTSQLQTTIDTAMSLDESIYTKESWSALTIALSEAQMVISNKDATQNEIDKATSNLDQAIQHLVLKDNTVKPSNPKESKPSENNKSSKDVKTGDSSSMNTYFTMLVFSLCIVTMLYKKVKD